MEIFETQQYGRAPGRPADESFEVIDKGTPALDGKAIRKQVTIYLSKDNSWPKIHLLIYLPAAAKKPVPMFFSINFGAVSECGGRSRDHAGRSVGPEDEHEDCLRRRAAALAGSMSSRCWMRASALRRSITATSIPDYLDGFSQWHSRALSEAGADATRAPDDWGSIAAWAWGMSRVEDYFETDKSIDAKRVAIHGVSRLGKTVMWAGAHDQRFAAVIASCSGEGGAALSHRDYGETIAHLTAPTRYPYQFAANYAKWGGFPDKAPMDANMLVALIAPRPLLLQTGSTDYWSDPKGEFLAAVAAGPVYKLLGKDGLDTDVWPAREAAVFCMTSPTTCTTAATAWCRRTGTSTSSSSRCICIRSNSSVTCWIDAEIAGERRCAGAERWCCRWLRSGLSRLQRLAVFAQSSRRCAGCRAFAIRRTRPSRAHGGTGPTATSPKTASRKTSSG